MPKEKRTRMYLTPQDSKASLEDAFQVLWLSGHFWLLPQGGLTSPDAPSSPAFLLLPPPVPAQKG